MKRLIIQTLNTYIPNYLTPSPIKISSCNTVFYAVCPTLVKAVRTSNALFTKWRTVDRVRRVFSMEDGEYVPVEDGEYVPVTVQALVPPLF